MKSAKADWAVAKSCGVLERGSKVIVAAPESGAALYRNSAGNCVSDVRNRTSTGLPPATTRKPTRIRPVPSRIARNFALSIGMLTVSSQSADVNVRDPISRDGRMSGTSNCVSESVDVVSTSYTLIVNEDGTCE